jgi:hypothetical protein
VSYFHCVKRGILGVRTVHWFGSDWGDLEEDCLTWESLQRGFARETLGELPTSELRHLGHNRQLSIEKIDYFQNTAPSVNEKMQ